jgi:hypothetical protein
MAKRKLAQRFHSSLFSFRRPQWRAHFASGDFLLAWRRIGHALLKRAADGEANYQSLWDRNGEELQRVGGCGQGGPTGS